MKKLWMLVLILAGAVAAGVDHAGQGTPNAVAATPQRGKTLAGPLTVQSDDGWLHLAKRGGLQWNFDYVEGCHRSTTPAMQIAADKSPLVLSLPAEQSGMRVNLWPSAMAIPDLPHTHIKPTFSVFGDVLIGDIIAIERNPMTYFMRAETGLPATAVTQFFSARAMNNDVDGGAGIVMSPDQPGPVNSGYLRLIAYGQGTGPIANSIGLATRSGPNVCEDRLFIAGSSGHVGVGTTAPARSLHVKDVVRLEPRDAPPDNPAEGDMYMDRRLHKLRVYDGSQWQNCW